MTIGLIGCGDISTRFYGPLSQKLRKNGLTEAIYCCDFDKKRSDEFKVQFGCEKGYTDSEDMISSVQPDCLILATPPSVTTNLAITLSRHRIPMLLEKPPALDVSAAVKLNEALSKNKVLHQVAFNRHFMPVIQFLKFELISKNRTIQCIHSLMSRYRRIEDTFFITAIHSIDLVRYISESIYKSVQISYQELPAYGHGVKNIFLDYEFENGICGQMSFMVCSGTTNERLMITCNDATYFAHLPMWDCDDIPGSVQCNENNSQSFIKNGNELDGVESYIMNGFYQQVESFIKSINLGIQPTESMEYSIEAIRIAELISQHKPKYRREAK
nr:Gfo/Idh/MocA family oxidoreductase [uncultured Sphaerochaeta sp.]